MLFVYKVRNGRMQQVAQAAVFAEIDPFDINRDDINPESSRERFREGEAAFDDESADLDFPP